MMGGRESLSQNVNGLRLTIIFGLSNSTTSTIPGSASWLTQNKLRNASHKACSGQLEFPATCRAGRKAFPDSAASNPQPSAIPDSKSPRQSSCRHLEWFEIL